MISEDTHNGFSYYKVDIPHTFLLTVFYGKKAHDLGKVLKGSKVEVVYHYPSQESLQDVLDKFKVKREQDGDVPICILTPTDKIDDKIKNTFRVFHANSTYVKDELNTTPLKSMTWLRTDFTLVTIAALCLSLKDVYDNPQFGIIFFTDFTRFICYQDTFPFITHLNCLDFANDLFDFEFDPQPCSACQNPNASWKYFGMNTILDSPFVVLFEKADFVCTKASCLALSKRNIMKEWKAFRRMIKYSVTEREIQHQNALVKRRTCKECGATSIFHDVKDCLYGTKAQ